ncbi:hypothetical protein KB206_17470 [Microvirga sp. STS02]|uniref:hypothetical protein n=1 Tax=Hymenobacter negativus TaxID=2795026 RepID=UPI0018DB8510|nr:MULTISPECIES: hypothetical protein [Bacteria]MBH8570686.1 hypothetical protein [Hymenobacter negativus]MBR7210424.1 hypothetical protein [Microvirga sp. STS02]
MLFTVAVPVFAVATRRARLLLAGLFALSLVVAFFTKGTHDSGDSINHYLFARYAFAHPLNFLDSWAKPLLTLLAAGPAQAGFMGMKAFQCVVVAASAWCAFRIAQALRLPVPELAILFAYAAPDYFLIQFSGLTEPLFGLVLVGAVWLAVAGRPGWSAAAVSFLPFARSEGFILIGLWVVYLAWQRQWRSLPLVLLGYVLYTAIGAVAFGELGWVFGHNPYGTISAYGHGEWSHFLRNIPNLLGWVLTVLFGLGGARMVRDLGQPARRELPLFPAELLLIYGSITVFVAAHTIFWAMGLFNSAGLARVLAGIAPLAAVVALNGLALLTEWARTETARRRIQLVATVAVVGWLFTGARNAIRPARDFSRAPDQELAQRAAAWLHQAYAGQPLPPIAFEAPYVAPALGVDPFDAARCPPLTKDWHPILETLPVNSLIVWDDVYAQTEAHIPLEMLQQDPAFRLRWHDAIIRDASHPDRGTCQLAVFERIK